VSTRYQQVEVLHCYTAQSLGNDINRYLAAGWFLLEGLGAFNCESGSGANFIAAMGLPAEPHSAEVIPLLREIEWQGDVAADDPSCPCCDRFRREGHTDTCKLKGMIG